MSHDAGAAQQVAVLNPSCMPCISLGTGSVALQDLLRHTNIGENPGSNPDGKHPLCLRAALPLVGAFTMNVVGYSLAVSSHCFGIASSAANHQGTEWPDFYCTGTDYLGGEVLPCFGSGLVWSVEQTLHSLRRSAWCVGTSRSHRNWWAPAALGLRTTLLVLQAMSLSMESIRYSGQFFLC